MGGILKKMDPRATEFASPVCKGSAGRDPLQPKALTATLLGHSRVVAAHGQQQPAEQPHIGVQPGGRHLPHVIYHTHSCGPKGTGTATAPTAP